MEKLNYIDLLKWVRDNPEEATYSQLIKRIESMGFPPSDDLYVREFIRKADDIFFGAGPKYILNFDGYFQLEEHERLEEARKDSKRAMKIATISMWIAIGTGVASILIGILQLMKP